MSDPATKQDLDQAIGVVRGEMAAMESRLRIDIAADMVSMESRLRTDMTEMESRIRTDMTEMESRIHTDMAAMEAQLLNRFDGFASNIAQVMSEQFRDHFKVLDGKYKNLPKQYAELRTDFDNHARDYRLHQQPVAVSTKRLRRTRSR